MAFLSKAINLCFVLKKISFIVWWNHEIRRNDDDIMGGDKTKWRRKKMKNAIQCHWKPSQTFFNLKECEIPRKAQRKTFCLLTFQITHRRRLSFYWTYLKKHRGRDDEGKYEIVKIIITVIVWEEIEMVSKVKDDDENDSNKTHITN